MLYEISCDSGAVLKVFFMCFRVFEKVKISTEYFLLEATGNIQMVENRK